MKISIVTISFNQARFLEQAIQSVIAQDYPNIQYIVVDPGSTDGSRDLIEKYRERIDKIIFQRDNGPADGLNKGFQAATGNIFGCLNSDDFLFPNTVSKVVAVFDRLSDIDVVSGHGLVVDENNRIKRRIYSHRFTPRMYAYHACFLVQPSTFFKAKNFWDAGGFNVENRVSWDSELWVDIALRGGKFARFNDFLSAFRIHKDSITGSGKILNEDLIQHERICRKIGIRHTSILGNRVLHLVNRLSDPKVTSMRIYDALWRNKNVIK